MSRRVLYVLKTTLFILTVAIILLVLLISTALPGYTQVNQQVGVTSHAIHNSAPR